VSGNSTIATAASAANSSSNLSLNNSLTTQFVFVGFSTINYNKNSNSTLYDIDLINADLTFAFQTRVGERLMRPDWGCRIWNYQFDNLDDYTTSQIIAEAQRIVSLDTRLVQQSIDVYQSTNGITIKLTLLYQPFAVIGTFLATFNSSQNAYFSGNN
jgi:phage baseplate assembly protein W